MRKRKPTPAQIQASRRNGARSTGPLTPQTRAISALNALTHGLTASTILLDGESRERFQQLFDELMEQLNPQSTLEFTAVEEIVVALWKQRRAWAMEAASFRAAARQAGNQAEPTDPAAHAVKAWARLHQRRGNEFHNLLLQQTRLNQQLDRAYRRFRQFVALRSQPEEPEKLSVFDRQNHAENAQESPQVIDSPCKEQENAK